MWKLDVAGKEPGESITFTCTDDTGRCRFFSFISCVHIKPGGAYSPRLRDGARFAFSFCSLLDLKLKSEQIVPMLAFRSQSKEAMADTKRPMSYAQAAATVAPKSRPAPATRQVALDEPRAACDRALAPHLAMSCPCRHQPPRRSRRQTDHRRLRVRPRAQAQRRQQDCQRVRQARRRRRHNMRARRKRHQSHSPRDERGRGRRQSSSCRRRLVPA